MKKIGIIKLGALGDVVRTLPLAHALKKHNHGSELHWITKNNALEIVTACSLIDKVHTLNEFEHEQFDELYNFDIEEEATQLAQQLPAKKKFGFSAEDGFPTTFNIGAEYYLNTVYDDYIKKTNTKTYQEMMFMAAEIPYSHELVPLQLNDADQHYAQDFARRNEVIAKKLVGIHAGADNRWPSKVWHPTRVKELVRLLKKEGTHVLLFAGPNEITSQANIIRELNEEKIQVFRNDPGNSIREFAALVSLCQKMVCSESFSLHISLAMKKPTIGLFFCTSPHEVEEYGLLKKVVSPLLYDFFPERSDEYNEDLVKSISAEQVLAAMKEAAHTTI